MNWMLASIVLIIALVIAVLLLVNTIKLKKELQAQTTFSNSTMTRVYNEFLTYLLERKSKLSLVSKMEILNKWNVLLTYLPRDYSVPVCINPASITPNGSTLTAAEHKKEIIETLNELKQLDVIDETLLSKLGYHLYYLIFM